MIGGFPVALATIKLKAMSSQFMCWSTQSLLKRVEFSEDDDDKGDDEVMIVVLINYPNLI